MNKSYSRQVSDSERLWILMDELCPPYANQMVLEGKGQFDIIKWKKAVREASMANPGSRVKLKGVLKYSKWIDSGRTPMLRVVDGGDWTGFSPENAPFLKKKLSIKTGSPCEVVLVKGKKTDAIIFRTSHSVMDGSGTKAWAKDIFRVLRDEKPEGSDCTMTDADLAKTFQDKYRSPLPYEHIAPTGKATTTRRGVTWRRIKLKGHYSKILPRVILITAKEAWRHGEGIVRFCIPVDLRPRKEGLRSTANLSIGIYVEVTKNSTVESISNDIKNQLINKNDGVLTDGQMMFEYLPIWLLKYKAAQIVKEQQKTGLYSLSGIVSNLGLINPSEFTYTGFKPETCFFIPPGIEALPYFAAISGMGDNLEILVTLPEAFADKHRFDNIIDSLGREFDQRSGVSVC